MRAVLVGFVLGVGATLFLAYALAPGRSDLDECLEACAPAGLLVWERDVACYCDVP